MRIDIIDPQYIAGRGADLVDTESAFRRSVEVAELCAYRSSAEQAFIVLFSLEESADKKRVLEGVEVLRRQEGRLTHSFTPAYVIVMGLAQIAGTQLEQWETLAAEIYRQGADEVHILMMSESLLLERLNALGRRTAERERKLLLAKRFEEAQELGNIGSWHHDLVTGELWWSPQVYRMFGYDAARRLPTFEEMFSYIHPEDRERYREAVERTLQYGEPFDIKTRIFLFHGGMRVFHCSGKPIFDEEGKMIEVSGIMQDVTERRLVEDELRHHEETLHYVSKFAPAALYQLRLDRQQRLWIDFYSLGSVTNFGQNIPKPGSRLEPYLGQYFSDSEMEGLLESCLESARNLTPWSGEFRIPDDSGEIRWVVARSLPTRFDDGSTVWRGILSDATEQKFLEEQLQMADRLSSVGTLAAGVAHEINNPLSFVMSNLEYSLEELRQLDTLQDNDEIELALRAALDGAQRISTIVKGLMTFVRHSDSPDEVIELKDVIQATIRMTGSQFRYDTELRVEMGQDVLVLGNEGQLCQVFVNLLLNALQAMPPERNHGNVITLRVMDAEDMVCVEIEDNGMGLPESMHKRLFDPFYSTKPIGEGIGLGLYVCRNIVTSMGGRLDFESVWGEGSRFRVYLHRAEDGLAS